MGYLDEFGTEWTREIAYVGVALELECPDGNVVSLLIRTGGDIQYQVAGSGAPGLPWPPETFRLHPLQHQEHNEGSASAGPTSPSTTPR